MDSGYEALSVYLRQKYRCETAYLFMGALEQQLQDLYLMLQEFGYVLVYREHSANLKGKKKGSVNVDIVFQVMRDIFERDSEGVVLVSGDGDYKRMVDYLVSKGGAVQGPSAMPKICLLAL